MILEEFAGLARRESISRNVTTLRMRLCRRITSKMTADFDNGVLRYAGLTGSQSAAAVSITDLHAFVKTDLQVLLTLLALFSFMGSFFSFSISYRIDQISCRIDSVS